MKKVLFSILSVLLVSCGYHFSGQGGLPQGIKTLEISIFENRTGYSGVTASLKDKFVSEFSKGGYVGTGADSHGILKGEIVRINVSTASKGSSDKAYERRVAMTINIRLENQDGQIVYERKAISDSYVYEASEGDSSEFGVSSDALDEVCEKISKRVVSIITSNF